jgi:hypothetical protein
MHWFRSTGGAPESLPLKFKIASGGFLIDVCLIWPVIFCACSFTLFFSIHPHAMDRVFGYEQIPTLSQTGMRVPESLVFTYGLHVEAALLAVLFTFLFAHFQRKIQAIESKEEPLLAEVRDENGDNLPGERVRSYSISCYEGWNYCCCCCCMPQLSRAANLPFLTYWNYVLWILGMSCALLMSLVGTITLQVNETVHGTIAFFMFLTGILHMLLYHFTIADSMGYSQFQLNLHRACLFVCIPFNIGMAILIGILYGTCNNGPCVDAAVQMSTALEYTTTLALIAYIYRFRRDLQDIDLIALTIPVKAEQEPENPPVTDEEAANYQPPNDLANEHEHPETIVNLMV